MQIYLFILIVLFSQSSLSAIWPDTVAPCNTTLDACAEATPEGSFVEVRTNSIDENVTVFKSISLIAGEGYRPVFSDGNGIDLTVSSSASHTLNIKGFTLTRGRISVNHLGTGELDLNISNNQFLANSSEATSIRVLQRGDGPLDLKIDYNTINHDFFTPGSNPYSGAITVRNNLNDGNISGRIYGNTIHVVGTNGSTVGVGIYDEFPGTVSLNITGNEIHTTHTGIRAEGILLADNMDLDISSNALYAKNNSDRMVGIDIRGIFRPAKFDVVNNSIIGALDGISITQEGIDSVDAQIFNNLIAFGPPFNIPVNTMTSSSSPSINNDYNLFYGFTHSDPDFIPGPNHLTSNPQIKSLINARLRPGSPAAEAGNTLALLFVGDAPVIDADGLFRIKKPITVGGSANVDIGAYETGDIYFTHKASINTTHITNLDNPNLNNNPNLDNIHVTSNFNPLSIGGVYNNDNEGIYYFNGMWRVFNQSIINMALNAAFNIHQYASNTNTFEQTVVGSTENNLVIDNSSVNNNPDRILQVTQNWTGVYNSHPISVFYFINAWVIINNDLATMNDGTNFNVYSQQSSKSAWQLRATAANSISNSVIIDHPLLNGIDCAQIQVTQSSNFGVFNTSPIGVWYNGSRWLIFNQDLSAIPENSAFHITINPEQIAACSDLIFANDFE